MKTKGIIAIVLMLCLLLAGCGRIGGTQTQNTQTESITETEGQTTGGENSTDDKSSDTVTDTDSQHVSNESDYPVFDFEKKTVTLNSGYEMPILGLGMFSLSDSEAENSTYWALKAGFRLVDTARIYGNEAAVGRGLRRAIDEGIVTREEVFITTKMWTSDFSNGDAAIDASLERLGVDYIDLMILHHSQPSNDVDAYQAMERAVADGKLKSIGLSNYYEPEDFDRLVNATAIKPALLQNETHPYHQSGEMKEHIAQYGTVLESSRLAAEVIHRRFLTMRPSAVLPQHTASLPHRSSSAGICRQAISASPAHLTSSISSRIMMCGILN